MIRLIACPGQDSVMYMCNYNSSVTQAGKVYICDLTILDGLKTKEGYYTCAPTCLLYVDEAKCLVPIAIQLKKQPGEDNPIFLPSDNLMDWLLAKIYYQHANTEVCYKMNGDESSNYTSNNIGAGHSIHA